MKTLSFCLLTAATQAPPAWSQSDLPRMFADCAGQYSARVEHAWLLREPDAGEYERFRDEFVALLDSVEGGESGLLHYRIEAKAAMAALLSQATFGTRPEAAQLAVQASGARLDACRLMLLGG